MIDMPVMQALVHHPVLYLARRGHVGNHYLASVFTVFTPITILSVLLLYMDARAFIVGSTVPLAVAAITGGIIARVSTCGIQGSVWRVNVLSDLTHTTHSSCVHAPITYGQIRTWIGGTYTCGSNGRR